MSQQRALQLMKLMVAAGLNHNALARKAGLPAQTILKALSGKATLSPVIYDGLIKTCEEEADANQKRR